MSVSSSRVVKFATLCRCGSRSAEYTSWPSCTVCHEYICPQCETPGSRTDADVDQPETNLCKWCREA
jgi:hypothetical protein